MAIYYAGFFPTLSSDDLWIKDFRSRFDPKASLVDPHLTLIFPTASFELPALVSEIRRVAMKTRKFSVICRSAIVMPEREGGHSQASLFLVPDEGFSDVVKLHDELYAGLLRPSLRLDVPFVPHVTIGSSLSLETAKIEVDKINQRNFKFSFSVEKIVVVEIQEPGSPRGLIESLDLLS